MFEAMADGGYSHAGAPGADAVTVLPASTGGWRDPPLAPRTGAACAQR